MSDETTFDISGLDKLLKALKGKPPTARIGVADTPHQDKDGTATLTNAQIGAFHEFGTSQLPVRSFLRMPLLKFLGKRLQQTTLLDKNTLAQVIATRSTKPWVEKIMIVAKEVVDEAFATGGYGTWPPSDMTRKETKITLVETAQLRESIVTEVKG